MRAVSLFLIFFLHHATGHTAPVLKPIIENLSNPIHVISAPGDAKSLFVVEQAGRIIQIDGTKRSVFLDIRHKVRSGGERGLLSVAFHPNYAQTGSKNAGRYFVNYTGNLPDSSGVKKLHTVVAEYVGDKERVLFTEFQPFSNHNGGLVAFGPDGYLYIGMGDGGAGGDPHNAAQNLRSRLGKMLRIDVDSPQKPYGIPADNPFADGKNGHKEIFAWGLRNPWRFSWDKRGRLFAADVGQNRLEEVHIISKGKNYGWRVMEGSLCFKPSIGCQKKGLELPIFEYGRSEGISITGGYVYQGSLADQRDKYFVGDYGSGNIWALTENSSGKWTAKLFKKSGLAISSFGRDPQGELLVVDHGGKVYRLTDA